MQVAVYDKLVVEIYRVLKGRLIGFEFAEMREQITDDIGRNTLSLGIFHLTMSISASVRLFAISAFYGKDIKGAEVNIFSHAACQLFQVRYAVTDFNFQQLLVFQCIITLFAHAWIPPSTELYSYLVGVGG